MVPMAQASVGGEQDNAGKRLTSRGSGRMAVTIIYSYEEYS